MFVVSGHDLVWCLECDIHLHLQLIFNSPPCFVGIHHCFDLVFIFQIDDNCHLFDDFDPFLLEYVLLSMYSFLAFHSSSPYRLQCHLLASGHLPFSFCIGSRVPPTVASVFLPHRMPIVVLISSIERGSVVFVAFSLFQYFYLSLNRL